ncbi:MAG: paraquat-inducible protein B [Gammaproteobacteria bacterium]|jgi:paraquat-inducible protein B
MTDNQTIQPVPLDVRPVKRPIWQRISVVWLVPVLALSVSLSVAYSSYVNQGTLIEISFENASGVTADETVIKYRDVIVGRVEKVEFAEGLTEVLVHARVDKTVAPYLDDDAQFWVVRPDVSVRGITGLDTVLGGVYIVGSWDTDADVAQYEFVGLEDPPQTRSGQRGTVISLRARDGSALSQGAPILHKGITVGDLGTPRLSFNGKDVVVDAFVQYPYDQRITSNTRFWDTSGFSLSLGAGGVSLDVNSIASLIEGGIAFDTVVSGGRPVRDIQIFDLFFDEETARSSLYSNPNQNAEVLNIDVLFDGSVRGLSAGSEVRFQGIRIGTVTDLSAIVVTDQREQAVRLRTNLAIEPSRLGLGADATPDDALAFLDGLVADGLRARMITGNILSGSLQVELVQVATAPPAILTRDADGKAIIPTTKSEITDVAATAEDVLDRINDLPIEELMSGAIDMMGSFERLANDEDLRAVPSSVTALLDEARNLVGGEDIQAVPADLRAAVSEMRDTIAGLNTVIAGANDAEIVQSLAATIQTANIAVTNIEEATRNLPAITARIEELTDKLFAIEIEGMVDAATQTLNSIDILIGSDATADLPATLSAALDEVRLFLGEVRAGGAIENVNSALASASAAAAAVETSVEGLPALSARASRLVSETEAVVQSYGARSRFSAETLNTLRDIQSAADAVTNLARTIQRNPSSLLTGR